jgi:hypothetical protein
MPRPRSKALPWIQSLRERKFADAESRLKVNFDPADKFLSRAWLDSGARGTSKIELSGRLSGKWRLHEFVRCLPTFVCARVLAGQSIYLGLQNCTAIHGKEKVYGSIP